MKEEQNRIEEILDTALEKIKHLLDVNTVIGEPQKLEDTTIIPVSKVIIGLLSGGGEYGNPKFKYADENLAGGLGTVSQVSPVGFLVYSDKKVKFVKAENAEIGSKIIEIVADTMKILTSLKGDKKCEII